MAATWMARTGVRTLLLEKSPSRTQSGHADGLESRTLEILDSFGIGERIWAESNLTMEVCLWVCVLVPPQMPWYAIRSY